MPTKIHSMVAKKILFRIWVLLVCLSLASVKAEDLYFAQAALGAGNGLSAANAKAIAQFNSSSAWSTPTKVAGLIGPGDVAHLVGTITTPLTIQGSGTSGNPVTILFESGASMSKSNWNQGGANVDSAIYLSGKTYITIDGGTNGVIESTSNGTGLASSVDNNGITVRDGSYVTIKNLKIRNLYVRKYGSETNYFATSINFVDSGSGPLTSLLIDNCTLTGAGQPVSMAYTNITGFEIKNSTISGCGIGINIGSNNVNTKLTGCLIHDNVISVGLEWSGWGGVHKNCIHAYAVHPGSALKGVKIYNNSFGGDMGENSTGYTFLEGYVYSALIYNNLFAPPNANFTGNGLVTIKGTDSCLIANNTFVGRSNAGTAIGTTGFGALGTNLTIKNNLLINCGTQIYDAIPAITSCDYNIYAKGDNGGFVSVSGFRTFASWQSVTGFDTHSTTSVPSLDANYAPTSSDSIARNKGADLSTYFTIDMLNLLRSTPWDIGAFDASDGGSGVVSPSHAQISISFQ